MPKFIDYYAALAVSNSASSDEIKSVYHQLALKYHPDHNLGDTAAEARFKDINEAYAVLSSLQKRRTYDQIWEKLRHGEEVIFASASETVARPSGFSDFFHALFRYISEGSARNGGEHIKEFRTGGEAASCSTASYELHISLGEALRGSRQELSVYCRSVCPTCNGVSMPREPHCPQCGGAGQLAKLKKVGIDLPKGLHSGARVPLDPALFGSRSGEKDARYLKIFVSPHPDFRVIGDDLETDLRVEARYAYRTNEVLVPALDGSFKLKIPRGLRSGSRLRVRGRGMYKKDGSRGDLYLIVTVYDESVSVQKRAKE